MRALRIIENPLLTEAAEKTVLRTWWERWFTRPWQPRVKTKKTIIRVSSKKLHWINNTTLVCHPVVAKTIRLQLRNKDLL